MRRTPRLRQHRDVEVRAGQRPRARLVSIFPLSALTATWVRREEEARGEPEQHAVVRLRAPAIAGQDQAPRRARRAPPRTRASRPPSSSAESWPERASPVTASIARPIEVRITPSPLAALELEAEEALGHHAEHDQPAGEHGLHERQRRERERAHVAEVGDDRERVADRPPLRAEQRDGAVQRVAHVHVGRLDRAAVAQQEADLADQSGQAGKHEPQEERHLTPVPGALPPTRLAGYCSQASTLSWLSFDPVGAGLLRDPACPRRSPSRRAPGPRW